MVCTNQLLTSDKRHVSSEIVRLGLQMRRNKSVPSHKDDKGKPDYYNCNMLMTELLFYMRSMKIHFMQVVASDTIPGIFVCQLQSADSSQHIFLSSFQDLCEI